MEKATRSGKTSSVKTNGAATPKASTQPGNKQMGTELEKLFIESLKDIYWAEKALTKALPKLAKASTTTELGQAFEEHLAQTEEHVRRLEQVFELMGQKAQAKKCDAMEGLQKEAEAVIEETEPGSLTRDVGLIIAAQKVEHYEIAAYGGLASLATTFGMAEVADLLQQTLDEEKETDENLTYIAENNVNFPAGIEDQPTETEEE
jgi:ferritin-like metal-binding protein YciE